jgi:hypothetical protein
MARGESFKPGETIQLGWMINQIVEDNGFLTIQEPDFIKFPIQWQRSVDNTLIQLRMQKDACESVALNFDFTSVVSSAVICTRLYQVRDVLLDRSDAQESRMSGSRT